MTDEFQAIPTTGIRAYANSADGITLESFEGDACIAISMDDARALRKWLAQNVTDKEADGE